MSLRVQTICEIMLASPEEVKVVATYARGRETVPCLMDGIYSLQCH